MKYKVLIVDDEEPARYGMRKALTAREYLLIEAADLKSARHVIDHERPDLVLLDVNLPDGSGIDLLRAVAARPGAPAIIVITAHGSERLAVEAIRAGAYEYLAKPFEVEELRLLVRNAQERARLTFENQELREALGIEEGFGVMVGASAAMKRVFEIVKRVAPTDVTILIRGESGTGKELVARQIHGCSPRSAQPFVAVNCAALPDSLIESELFGHEKGAFTGAVARRLGKFQLADAGTLFLDEIGDMAPATQAKILRVIEERKLEPLGSHDTVDVDVRLVAATHRNLEKAVSDGAFREDLYYRIKVIEIELPPLRERREDIDLLLEHFGRRFARKYDIEWGGFTEPALRRLRAYHWPGNVRELRNLAERCSVLSLEGSIDVAELPGEVHAETGGPEPPENSGDLWQASYDDARAAFEKRYLLGMLERHGGNISQAAATMKMHRQTLQYKLKQLGIRKAWHDA